MSNLHESWVSSANDPDCHFPLNNLPCGVFSHQNSGRRCGVAIGDFVLDCQAVEREGLFCLGTERFFDKGSWNALMSAGPEVWADFRNRLVGLLQTTSSHKTAVEQHLLPLNEMQLHLPFLIAEFTDFYSGRHHATNVGTMFRGAENALPPNWLHIPIGYNGRASSVYVSGTDFHRPWGQLKSPKHEFPAFMPSRRFDFELEIGAIVGQPSNGPVNVEQADDMIFGYVLLNDWSARDIQAWEYQPLGPFQAKATATTISPWIVMKAALEPFRVSTPDREFELLEHLREPRPLLYDIALQVSLQTECGRSTVISRTNYREMYYSAAQQLAHHTTAGAPMNVGDLLGSGTISGPDKTSRGSMLELSWGGSDPVLLEGGEERTFLEDGDTVTFTGAAQGSGYSIGFGECSGKVLPALDNPFERER